MAPALVLAWAWWSRRHASGPRPRAERIAVLVILLSYLVQFAGLAAGIVAARGYADPLAHVTDFAGLVAVIVAAEYAGHAAAAVLGVKTLRRRKVVTV